MLWLRCFQKEKTPSKAERVKEKNESYMKCRGSYGNFCEDDYQGLSINILYQKQKKMQKKQK